MKTIKNFFIAIKDSFYNPQVYSNIKNVDGSRFVGLVLALSLISSLVIIGTLLPSALNFAENINTNEIKEYFPNDLEITFKDGVATSNKDGQYYFGEIPKEERELGSKKKYAVLVDTTSEYTLTELKEADAYFMVTKDAFLGEEDGELRVYYYADIFQDYDFTLNQEKIDGWIEQIKGWVKPMVWGLSVFMIGFLMILLSIGWFFLALLFSIATKVLVTVKKVDMTYMNVYKTTLFALLPVMTIALFIPFLPIWVKLLMFLVILGVNMERV